MSTSLISGTENFTFTICSKGAKKKKSLLISLFYSKFRYGNPNISNILVKSIHKSGTSCKIQKDMTSRSVLVRKHIKNCAL